MQRCPGLTKSRVVVVDNGATDGIENRIDEKLVGELDVLDSGSGFDSNKTVSYELI